jgi:hypothetical protein
VEPRAAVVSVANEKSRLFGHRDLLQNRFRDAFPFVADPYARWPS